MLECGISNILGVQDSFFFEARSLSFFLITTLQTGNKIVLAEERAIAYLIFQQA